LEVNLRERKEITVNRRRERKRKKIFFLILGIYTNFQRKENVNVILCEPIDNLEIINYPTSPVIS